MRLLILLAAILAGLTGCDSKTYVSAANPYVRLSAVPGQPAAGYASLQASADHLALKGVTSARAGKIELHETMSAGAMTMMQPIERIDLVKSEEVAFAPGKRHLMLFGLDPKLKPGDRIPLTFHFAEGEDFTVDAMAIAAGDDAPK
jgi:copper(I)-binding protein